MPNPLNLRPDHCLGVIARRRYPDHGNRLGSTIKGGPELDLDQVPSLHLTRTMPNHWGDLREAFFPDSGRPDPLRDPARFAQVRAPPPLKPCQ